MQNKITCCVEWLFFKSLQYMMKKYDFQFLYRDRLGIISERCCDDNLKYIFQTHNSCDAIPMMVALDNMIKGSSIAMDIGAHIGITSIWMAGRSKWVYSFEPESRNRKRMSENIGVNSANNIEVVPLALSDKEGEYPLFIHESSGHHSLGRAKITPIIAAKTVKTTTIDLFSHQREIPFLDLVKIDVEGFEEEVLLGAQGLLKTKRIRILILEHSLELLKQLNKRVFNVHDILSDYGYRLYDLNHRLLCREDMAKIEQGDIYAVSS